MITVDCHDIEPIKHELAVYVAERLGGVPALKAHEFVVAPLGEDDAIDGEDAAGAVRSYLDSIGEARNYAVLPDDDRVVVHSITGRALEPRARPADSMFSCPHCGFVTSYEEEYNVHKRIHYL